MLLNFKQLNFYLRIVRVSSKHLSNLSMRYGRLAIFSALDHRMEEVVNFLSELEHTS